MDKLDVNFGRAIMIVGIVLAGITVFAAFVGLAGDVIDFVFFFILLIAGIFECLLLVGFGQLVSNVYEIKLRICGGGTTPSYKDELPDL